MNGFRHSSASTAAALLLGVVGWGLASPAAAACSCMCVDEVAYEVCTGIVSTQAITAACTTQLDCAAVPVEEPAPAPEEPAPPVEPPASAGTDLDCRRRNVYRPDLGHYKPYTVCMPADRAAAHERLRAKRAEIKAQHAAWKENHGRRNHGHGRWHDDD